MRIAESLLVGIALALVVVGAALLLLTQPFVTRLLSERYSLASEAGLSSARIGSIAEQVRAFVVSADSPTLPATVDGRPGFDASAVSHLVDVRRIISAAMRFSVFLMLLVVVWFAVRISKRRFDRVASAFLAGAVSCVAFVLLMGVAGVADFDRLFTAFHSVFFAAGTWTFDYDSLLIQTFPEPFWAVAGASWAALILLGGGVLGMASWWMRRSWREPRNGTEVTRSANGA